ncbi:S41 family peptidase [Bradyrhizobium sp. CB2312]|uniref:S41 family peptidase n=1 Tax=Bradyrhizobium sp. CB2312 TaxID=3039155 RepID=UPI0024B20FC4|nr:S41 family peptidase [Bradyrhizobium sp. CB2312]WFU71459.1 S41 family peptidase [Bradyrhizobium sp. CB2312]
MLSGRSIAPAPNHYTKKVVVAVNENSFSAAEFLAAIMQDNHQAIIFGQRTGGAGGLVRSVELSPDFKKAGISDFKLTWTLAWRSSGSPIEDLGVTPDIFYNITVDDLRSGYVGYREALLATAVKQ